MTPIETPPNPFGETAQIPCARCGDTFTTEAARFGSTTIHLSKVCIECVAAIAKEEAAKEKERRERTFLNLAGAFYTKPEIRAAMPMEQAKQCRALVTAGRGIIATGLSGRFKTTCMLNGAVRWLILNGNYVLMMTGAGFNDKASEAAKACRLEAFKRPLIKADWLYIDDLGHKMTESGGEALHDILEHRMREGRPVLVTTQFSAEKLVQLFERPETGLAVARRLRELCDPVNFDQPTTTP